MMDPREEMKGDAVVALIVLVLLLTFAALGASSYASVSGIIDAHRTPNTDGPVGALAIGGWYERSPR